MKLKSHLLLIAIICSALNSANAQQPPSQVINVTTPEWQGATNLNGTGIYFEIIKAIYEPLGFEINVKFVPFKRALIRIESKKSDIMFGVYSSEVNSMLGDNYLLTPEFHLNLEHAIAIYKKERNFIWHGVDTLKNHTATLINGYDYHLYLDIEINYVEVNTPAQGWKLLNSDRADFFIHDLAEVEYYFNEMGIPKENYQTEIVISKPVYAGFSKSLKSKELLEIYNKRMRKLIKNGQLAAIYKKWGYENPYSN